MKSIVTPGQSPVERNLDDFIYEAIEASSFINVSAWKKFFDEIPVDPYIKEGYRYKAIAWFRIKHALAPAIKEIDKHIKDVNKLSGMTDEESNNYTSDSAPTWKSSETGYWCWNLPQYAMQQSILYNPVHGNMRREYPRINESVIDSEDFHRLLIHYASFFGWNDAIVLVQ